MSREFERYFGEWSPPRIREESAASKAARMHNEIMSEMARRMMVATPMKYVDPVAGWWESTERETNKLLLLEDV